MQDPNNTQYNRRRGNPEHRHGRRPFTDNGPEGTQGPNPEDRHSHPEHRHGGPFSGPHAGPHGGRFGERNFWSEWRDERHHHGRGEDIPVGQALSPKEMEAWREFFHQTFGNWPEEHWIFGGRRFSPWHQGMDTFNPFVATLLSKGGGLLPLYVLHLIAQQPRYGNEIMDLLAERTNGQWVSNPGAIYPLLTQLEKEGFIEGKWEDPDKRTVRIYTITTAGQAEVSRIEMIVMPKLTETVQVLQDLINDLQTENNPASETNDQAGRETDIQAAPDTNAQAAPDTNAQAAPDTNAQAAPDTDAHAGTEPL
jgi:DNA-binding PadR family transcriptional regulator